MKMISVLRLLLGMGVLVLAHEECGTPDLTPEQAELEKAHDHRIHGRRRRLEELCIQCIPIDVVFHIIEDEQGLTNASLVWSDDFVQTELDWLNEGFRETPFEFHLRDITRTVNDTLAFFEVHQPSEESERAPMSYGENLVIVNMVQSLRIGGKSVLNVFVNRGLCLGANGHAAISSEYGLLPSDVGSPLDRVFICDNIFGIAHETLIHEVGHFLGLSHTFGLTCEYDDEVRDTPHELKPEANGTFRDICNIGRNSCPEQTGIDPIHNFMTYSGCRTEFTPGQIERMYHKFNEERRRVEPCQDVEVSFEIHYDDGPTNGVKLSLKSHYKSGALPARVDLIGRSIFFDFNFTRQHTSRLRCFPKEDLQEISFSDSQQEEFPNGTGYFSITMNGRELTRSNDKYKAMLVGESRECPEESSRLRLDMSFNHYSTEFPIKWQIRRFYDSNTVVLNHTISTEPGDEFYSSLFRGRTLFVERCLPKGVYVFEIEDTTTGDIFFNIDHLRVALGDTELYFRSSINSTVVGKESFGFAVFGPFLDIAPAAAAPAAAASGARPSLFWTSLGLLWIATGSILGADV